MVFTVEVKECLIREVEIEAANVNEAEEKVIDMVENKEIVLGLNDRTNVAEVECWGDWE